MEPFDKCTDDLTNLDLYFESSLAGMHQASQSVGWLEAHHHMKQLREHLGGRDPEAVEPPSAEQVASAQGLEAFATTEIGRGHPYLTGLATSRLWSILEAFTDGTVLDRIRARKVDPESQPLASIKLPVGSFLPAPPDEQALIVLEELKQATRARVKEGVGRFETLLGAVGLGGAVAAPVRRAILECCQVRNVVVHCSGVADARFAERCPWFDCTPGQPLPLQASHFRLYQQAAHWYALEVLYRQRASDGEPDEPRLRGVRDMFLANVERMQTAREASPIPGDSA